MSTFIGNTLESSTIISRKNSLHTAREDVNQIRKKENAEKGIRQGLFSNRRSTISIVKMRRELTLIGDIHLTTKDTLII